MVKPTFTAESQCCWPFSFGRKTAIAATRTYAIYFASIPSGKLPPCVVASKKYMHQDTWRRLLDRHNKLSEQFNKPNNPCPRSVQHATTQSQPWPLHNAHSSWNHSNHKPDAGAKTLLHGKQSYCSSFPEASAECHDQIKPLLPNHPWCSAASMAALHSHQTCTSTCQSQSRLWQGTISQANKNPTRPNTCRCQR